MMTDDDVKLVCSRDFFEEWFNSTPEVTKQSSFVAFY